MTSPISAFTRQNQVDAVARKTADETQSKGDSAAAENRSDVTAVNTNLQDDVLQLSDVALKAMEEPSFDRTRVDAIKQAIAENGYPIDPRRIAEQFVAIEKMIKE